MGAAILLALAAAMLFAAGSVLQQRAARSIPDQQAQGLGLVRVVRRPLWVAGTLADVSGFVAQAAALGFGALLVVQPLIATTLLFALPLAAMWAGRRLSSADWGWAVLLVAGLAVFLSVGNPSPGVDRAPVGTCLVAGAIVLPIVAVCTAIGLPRRGPGRAVPFAIAGGILFGVVGALTKSVVSLVGDGAMPLFSAWEPYALVASVVAGTYLQQAAYQTGELALSLPAIAVLEPLVASALGVGVLDESISTSALGWVLLVTAGLAMLCGLVALPRAAAALHEPPPAPSEGGGRLGT